jgi:hypothetical protein
MTTSSQATVRRATSSTGATPLVIGLCIVAAALMVVSGIIHIHLWNIAYRHVKSGHLNVLFLIQAIAALVGAVALVALRRLIIVAGSAALMAGTVLGFLWTRYHSNGWFGFKLPYWTTDAKWAFAVEIAAVVMLAITAATMSRNARGTS